MNIADELQKEIAAISKLNAYTIEIGVISGNSQRQTISVGVTNAELMFIHENGSPVNNIPARPVLDISIRNALSTLIPKFVDKAINGLMTDWTDNKLELELGKLCMRIQNFAQDVIYSNDGRLAPNAPRVAAAKGGNYPLHDTGQLARSITCRFIKT